MASPTVISKQPLPSPYAKKGPYVTKLAPEEEAKFQAWVKANKIPWQDSPTADYDMRGYFKAMLAGNQLAKTQVSQFDGKTHFPDTYKTPYHKTFSNESMYALPTAPKWVDNRLTDSRGRVIADETPKQAPQIKAGKSK